MQTNNNYGAWVGLGIIILVGAIVLGAFGAGAFDPERQAAANRTNAETALFQEQALQEIAANKAEIQARIENAPALAQLDLVQKQQEIRQQQKDFELTSAIKKAGTVALLALAAAGLIGAIGYTTTRVMARREAPQRRTSPSPKQANPAGPPQYAAAAQPPVQPSATNGHGDPRWREYRQMLEQNYTASTLTAQRITDVEDQIMALRQQQASSQAAMQQAVSEIKATQVAASQEIAHMQTTLRQLEEAVRASNATLARNNGQSWHADDSREPGKAAGGHNGTGYHNKDVIDPNNQLWRKAA